MNEQIEDLIYDLKELKLDPQAYTNETMGETGGPTGVKTETFNDPGVVPSNPINKRRNRNYNWEGKFSRASRKIFKRKIKN